MGNKGWKTMEWENKEHTPLFLQKASNCSSLSSRGDGSGKKGVWNISMRTPKKEKNNKGINNKQHSQKNRFAEVLPSCSSQIKCQLTLTAFDAN